MNSHTAPRRVKSCHSNPVSIFIAGDADKAEVIAREYCDGSGFCVTVTRTNYIYTGGQEWGVVIGLINYPRFPSTPDDLSDRAWDLAKLLRTGLGQESFSIQTPTETNWFSWRDEVQAIEAGTDKTGTGLAVGESAVPQGMHPNTIGVTP